MKIKMAFFGVAQSEIRNYAEGMGVVSLHCLQLYLVHSMETVDEL